MKISLIAQKTAFELLLWNGLEILLWQGDEPLFYLSYKDNKFILGDDKFDYPSQFRTQLQTGVLCQNHEFSVECNNHTFHKTMGLLAVFPI